jgi:PAS domain S-box-containing protein
MSVNHSLEQSKIIESILNATAAELGESFFRSLVKNLSTALKTCGAWITEYVPEQHQLKALAFWLDNQYIDHFEYHLNDTPCEHSISNKQLLFIPDKVMDLYPGAKPGEKIDSVSYIGVPLYDKDKNVIGHLAAIDRKPMEENEYILSVFRIFANRAGAELQRLKIENDLKEKNECLENLVNELQQAKSSLIESESRFRSVAQSANDAIITSDIRGNITFWNERAEKMFGYKIAEILGKPLTLIVPKRYHKAHNQGFNRFVSTKEGKIIGHIVELHAIKKDGSEFPIELTLSDWKTQSGLFITGIIRDITLRKNEQAKLEKAHALLAAEDQRKSEELEKARQLQLAMLPTEIPDLKRFDVKVHYQTAIEVGGDYYDIIRKENGETLFLMGDAAGHGLEPGMVVAIIKSIIASLADYNDLSKIFDYANNIFKSLNLGRLFMALSIIRIRGNNLEICAGGMPPLLIYRNRENKIDEYVLAAPPIGSVKKFKYSSNRFSVEKGDVILLQTDGFSERQNNDDEMYGFDRTKKLFCAITSQSPDSILKKLVDHGETWAAGQKQTDDITLMTIKLR